MKQPFISIFSIKYFLSIKSFIFLNKVSLLFLILLNSQNNATAQVETELSIQNQTVAGGDFQFDVFLRTTAATSGDLFLGDADFVLTFNPANFNNPILGKVGAAPGACNFIPTDPTGVTGLNTVLTRINYFNNTSTAGVSGNELIINLAGPTPGNQTAFDDGVAKIDGMANTHRLGTFQLSGYISGNTDLQWTTNGGGSETQVHTLANTPPFISTAAAIVTVNPPQSPLPVELINFVVRLNENKHVEIKWETVSETNNAYFMVERSANGINWNDLIKKEGAGNSLEKQVYSAIDKKPIYGVSYYRLKQMDYDGEINYSIVKSVRVKKDGSVSFSPNPVKDSIRLESERGICGVQISDLKGQLVFSSEIDGLKYFEINVSGFEKGMYLMKIKTPDDIHAFKIMK